KEVEAKSRLAEQRLRESRQHLADLSLTQGLGYCEKGEVAQGLLWLARSLALAQQAGAADLERGIRWNLSGWQPLATKLRMAWQADVPVTAAAFSADGRRVVIASGIRAQLRDVATGRLLGPELKGAKDWLAVALAGDGRTVVTGGREGMARVWNGLTGEAMT